MSITFDRQMVFRLSDKVRQSLAAFIMTFEAWQSEAILIRYRSDIDGLRAVAVLSVVLYHFGVSAIPGGFVGVDIFFVISGFLMSEIISGDIAKRRFSLARFYERRARRILPALCAVLVVTSALAYWLFFPTELEDFAASLQAATLFSANNYFYMTSNYFAPEAERLPLLHLWSLGVEEQFYLVFPLLLLALRRRSATTVRAVILSLCLASFVASASLTHFHPTMTFFLLPFRAFELLIGSLVALIPNTSTRRAWAAAGVTIAGLAAIAVSIVFFSTTTEFPGFAALLPCGGTALVIWGGSGQSNVVSNVIGRAPLVAVGRISYSLYLVHWPVLVFGQQLFPAAMPNGKLFAFFAVSLILAGLSTRFIERPFRTGAFWSGRRVVAAAFPSIIVFCVVAQIVQVEKGFPRRFSKDLATLQAYAHYDPAVQFREGRCFLRPEQTAIIYDNDALCFPSRGTHHAMLWGDSLAAHLFAGLNGALERRGWTLAQATASACAPILDFDAPSRPNCRGFNNQIFTRIQSYKPDILIVASSWNIAPGNIPALEETLAKLRDSGIVIVVLGPPPIYETAAPNILARRMLSSDHSRFADGAMVRSVTQAEGQMSALAQKYGLNFVSILDRLCKDGNCPLTTPAGIPLQFDTVHFTAEGSDLVADEIAPIILATARSVPQAPHLTN